MHLPSITASDLKSRLDAGERLALLDVREDHERQICAIPVQPEIVDLHIPMGQIPARIEDIATIGGSMVVYCHHGVRSLIVAQWLASKGVEGLINLQGGIDAWSIVVDRSVARY